METIKKITGEVKISSQVIDLIQNKADNISELKGIIKENIQNPITKLIEIIFSGSINIGSSDIHFEPEEDQCRIRVRIDGILQELIFIPQNIYRNILSRIKLLSGIKLNINDKPQDGRFSIIISTQDIEIRTSTLPTEYGESVVLRILNPKSLINMEALGLRNDLFVLFENEIKKPNGMIIVTGPTGSGKTTTLYSFLKKIQRPEIKIITIEDPVEYRLKGISQTQTNPSKGYDFANGLRSIMRQDPDVILVGEIRDAETAKIAIQAALTGHLVLTTLHTNDAAGTISRLISLGADPSNIGPAINIIIAQRLVRKVCKKCVKTRDASPKEIMEIKNELETAAISFKKQKIEIPKIISPLKIPKAIGCKDCNFTGFKGRVGIFETIVIDEEIENLILSKSSISSLRKLAIRKGMISMKQDGILKILKGDTTIEEVKRVTG